ncbi:MAG: class I SAM-dependent methyltransferase, partial [Thermodesulfobacteriota bacterium]
MTSPCRACGTPLAHTFVDLGVSPLANRFLGPADLSAGETFYPLHARVCSHCLLVQLEETIPPEAIFTGDYPYFSSYAATWQAHCQAYAQEMIPRLGLDGRSLVLEIAANDGTLLGYFARAGIPVLGVEPAAGVAQVAIRAGIPTEVDFFTAGLARRLAAAGRRADLVVGNNVLAHVPDLAGFVAGLGLCLKEQGTITLEFPHLLHLMAERQFDTIYHEHFSYFSLLALERIFEDQGLTVFDVKELPIHGGSLRIFVRHKGDGSRPVRETVSRLRAREEAAGLHRLATYTAFAAQAAAVKRDLLSFLIREKDQGRRIAGYGAPAKGNTLL